MKIGFFLFIFRYSKISQNFQWYLQLNIFSTFVTVVICRRKNVLMQRYVEKIKFKESIKHCKILIVY